MSTRRLFVLSDLHLGGRPDGASPGTAICSESESLADLICWIGEQAKSDPASETEIVINGDVFDFLCELEASDTFPTGLAADEDVALALASRFAEAYPFDNMRSPMGALRHATEQGCRLTVLVGNHDVELSYPRVRQWFEHELGLRDGRMRFVFDGEAYFVGDVLIEHGNRYDPWNVIDHDNLRRDRSLMSRGMLISEGDDRNNSFNPPAGSYLVAYVINELKKQYRFLDLLKPETAAMVPLLLTLCPPAAPSIQNLIALLPKIVRRQIVTVGVSGGRPMNRGMLSADADDSDLRELLCKLMGEDAADLFVEPSADEAARTRPLSSGWSALARGLVRKAEFAKLLLPASREKTLQRLHQALRRLPTGFDFDVSSEEKTYLAAAKRLTATGRFAVVLFGHTHLPKEISWDEGEGRSCKYINTGTWADVMRVPDACVVEDFSMAREALESFARDLAENDYRKYVECPKTYAEVVVRDGTCSTANLWCYRGRASPRATVGPE